MNSMTGYGYAELQDEKYHLSLTLKSYNNRFLDLFVYMPAHLSALEQKCRAYLNNNIARGRVELHVKSRVKQEDAPVVVDRASIQAYVKALREMASAAGIKEDLRLSHLLRIEGLLNQEKTQDLDAFWTMLEPLLDTAFNDFSSMRQTEGTATQKDIQSLVAIIKKDIAAIEKLAANIETEIQEKLRSRFDDLLPGSVDENRILSETAVMLMKYDINEELVRIRTHLAGFENVLAGQGAIGKKLDFICQELNREVNTIASKSTIQEVNSIAISLKDNLEKIREQLRNVE